MLAFVKDDVMNKLIIDDCRLCQIENSKILRKESWSWRVYRQVIGKRILYLTNDGREGLNVVQYKLNITAKLSTLIQTSRLLSVALFLCISVSN